MEKLSKWVLFFLDKYGSKHTGRRINVQANIRGRYGQLRMDVVYILERTNGVYTQEGKEREGKDTRTLRLNNKTYIWYKFNRR